MLPESNPQPESCLSPPAAGPSRKRAYEEDEDDLDDEVKRRLAALKG